MVGRVEQICRVCGSAEGFTRSDDGFFYCGYCNSQADDIIDTAVDEEHLFNLYNPSCTRVGPAANVISAEPISQLKQTASQYLDHPDIQMDDGGGGGREDGVGDGVGPTEPSDFGSSQKNFSYEEYYSEIRSRYLTGLQIMIQLQCQALVEKLGVSPLIVGLIGPIWLRYLASTGVTADDWADKAVHDSEVQAQGEAEEVQPSAKSRSEPVNIHGKRVVSIWYRSISSALPLSCSLAISFLFCHVAREAVLPTDILKWALEGKLPYFAAFDEIEKQLGPHSGACPISASRMFRPIQAISSQKLESMAAQIAQKIGLELPPVNFYAIASRYCMQLSLPTEDILPTAISVWEWSTPAELYLSANELRIPTRACVMSILIVAIRILFDINGYGMWESILSDPSCSLSGVEKDGETESESRSNATANANEDSPSRNTEPQSTKTGPEGPKMTLVQLLRLLEVKYNELDDGYAYSTDLLSYLQYCKDVVFAGLRPSYEDFEEEKLIQELWDFYQNNKDAAKLKNQGTDIPVSNTKSRNVSGNEQEEAKSSKSGESACSTSKTHDQDSVHRSQLPDESPKDRAIRRLKMDMEENRFCYVPPRVRVKRRDYLHYARRRKDVFIYAVHADYYILLRSCAKVAQVEPRVMHTAVLSFERRLAWIEKRIEYTLNLNLDLDDVCDYCKDDGNAGDDPMDQNV